MRIPHFYYGYYVYQYATGVSAATAVVDRIREEGAPAAEDYLAALRLGGSDHPDAVLARAGVDVTDDGYVRTALDTYEGLLDRLAAETGTA
jgi:oligoendopeptidase F